MALDTTLLLILAGSILFLAALVWKMYENARKPEWSDVSAKARESRKETEQEHGR
ncbi:MAG: hypothetical protein KGH63_01430 [Candidatus Micrarchaeota archaeon]|nr:hypothetical protein [Candidatus Micrarchaeota archaeon]